MWVKSRRPTLIWEPLLQKVMGESNTRKRKKKKRSISWAANWVVRGYVRCCVLELDVDNTTVPLFLFFFLLYPTLIWSPYNIRRKIYQRISDKQRACVNPIFYHFPVIFFLFFRLHGRDFFQELYLFANHISHNWPSHSWLHLASDPL